MHRQTDRLAWCCDVLFTSGLTFSLQVLVRRGHCKVCEGESLECILVVQLVSIYKLLVLKQKYLTEITS